MLISMKGNNDGSLASELDEHSNSDQSSNHDMPVTYESDESAWSEFTYTADDLGINESLITERNTRKTRRRRRTRKKRKKIPAKEKPAKILIENKRRLFEEHFIRHCKKNKMEPTPTLKLYYLGSQNIDEELFKTVDEYLEFMFPRLAKEAAKSGFQINDPEVKNYLELRKTLKNFTSKDDTPWDVYDAMIKTIPNKSFYLLLTRHARRKKRPSYVHDCLNTVTVLRDQLPQITFEQFLEDVKTYRYQPASKRNKSRGGHFQFIKCPHSYKLKGPKTIESQVTSAVTRIQSKMRFTYADLSTSHLSTLASVGQLSTCTDVTYNFQHPTDVSNNYQYSITSNKSTMTNPAKRRLANEGIPVVDRNEDPPSYIVNDSLQVTTEATIGYHLPQTLDSKLWIHLLDLKLGYDLFTYLFHNDIVRADLYPRIKCPKKKIIQFFLKATSRERERNDYMKFLAVTSVIYYTIEYSKTPEMRKMTKSFLIDGKEHEMPSILNDLYLHMSDETIGERARTPYEYFINNHSVRYVDFSAFNKKKNRRQKQCYFVKGFIIQRYTTSLKNQDCRHFTDLFMRRSVEKKEKTENKNKSVNAPIDNCQVTGSKVDGRHNTKLPIVRIPPTPAIQPTIQQTIQPTVPPNISPTPTIPLKTYSEIIAEEDRWKNCEIVTSKRLANEVLSSLFIDTGNELYELKAAPIEVYTATKLLDRHHWRISQSKQNFHSEKTKKIISSTVTSYIDFHADVLSVARPGSSFFESVAPLKGYLSSLMKIVAMYGSTPNTTESRQESRASRYLDIGIKPELQGKCYGMTVFNICDIDTEDVQRMKTEAKLTLPKVIDFIWEICQSIQTSLNRPPLGGNLSRRQRFGEVCQKYTGCFKSEFEAVRVVHTLLSPLTGNCKSHKDRLNDYPYTYSKTGCLDCIFQDGKNDLHLLQVICNFRKHAYHMEMGDYKYLELYQRHVTGHHNVLKSAYTKAFLHNYKGEAKSLGFISNPPDLTDFFLDDLLPYENVHLETNESPMTLQVLVLPIGTSRIFSLSMVLDPIYKLLENGMAFDQLVEICFLATFFATPLLFNEALTQLTNSKTFKFGEHPYFDIVRKICEIFPKPQGGQFARFSTGSNEFITFFDNDPQILVDIVTCLLEWIDYVDNHRLIDNMDDIHFVDIEDKYLAVVNKIKSASHAHKTKIEFDVFRLSIFTTLATGLGLTEPGEHTQQFVIPTKKAASNNHLRNPDKHLLTNKNAKGIYDGKYVTPNESSNIDRFGNCKGKNKGTPDNNMWYLSRQMEWNVYCRDDVETALCESVPCRQLKKKDVFRKGTRLFWMRIPGIPHMKLYGKSRWIPLQRPNKKYKFIPHQ